MDPTLQQLLFSRALGALGNAGAGAPMVGGAMPAPPATGRATGLASGLMRMYSPGAGGMQTGTAPPPVMGTAPLARMGVASVPQVRPAGVNPLFGLPPTVPPEFVGQPQQSFPRFGSLAL